MCAQGGVHLRGSTLGYAFSVVSVWGPRYLVEGAGKRGTPIS